MRYQKRTLVDADAEIDRILFEQRKLLSWLNQNHPNVRKEYDNFRLAEAFGEGEVINNGNSTKSLLLS